MAHDVTPAHTELRATAATKSSLLVVLSSTLVVSPMVSAITAVSARCVGTDCVTVAAIASANISVDESSEPLAALQSGGPEQEMTTPSDLGW